MPKKPRPERKTGWNIKVSDFYFPIALSFLMAIFDYYGTFAGVKGATVDTLWLRHRKPASQKDIVVLEIDDRTHESFFQPNTPMDPDILVSLIKQIASARPAILGVDVLTEGSRYRELQAELTGYLNRQNTPVVWASGGGRPFIHEPNIFLWLGGKDEEMVVRPTPVLGFEPGEPTDSLLWGPAVFPTEQDSKLRQFPSRVELSADPGRSESVEKKLTWARTIAETYCKQQGCEKKLLEPDKDVYVSVAGDAAPHISVLDLFGRREKEVFLLPDHKALLHEAVSGKIALLGGTFADSGDFHATPEGFKIAGIFVNARAIAGEIAGLSFSEISQPWSLLSDIFSGCLVVVIFGLLGKAQDARTMMKRSAMTAAVIMAGLLLSGRLFNVAAVVIGTILQQLYDFWHENPKTSEEPESKHTAREGQPGSHRE